MSYRLLPACFLIFLSMQLHARVSLPSIFADQMILQQKSFAAVWGRGVPGEAVTVIGSWNNHPISTYADSKGKWLVKLETIEAGGPYTLTIRGENEIVLKDVWLGEVWLASGQSNMVWELDRSLDPAAEIAQAEDPKFRFYTVERSISSTPRFDCKGKWEACTPSTAAKFSAVAYYFGKRLRNELNVPVAIIETAWGGSSIEAWTSRNVMENIPDFTSLLSSFDKRVSEARANPKLPDPINHQSPAYLYNAMLAPLIPYTIQGVIWYQGEYNTRSPYLYEEQMRVMIQSWRRAFMQNFSFFLCSIGSLQLCKSSVRSGYTGSSV